jgi:hypothetical protein
MGKRFFFTSLEMLLCKTENGKANIIIRRFNIYIYIYIYTRMCVGERRERERG